MKVITSVITQTDDIKVGLLIGANFMKALEHLKVISSVEEVSALWVLLPTWLVKISLIQLAVVDATFSSISSHHFVMEEPMKEVILVKMFQATYINDFNEVSTVKLNSRVIKDVYKKFPLKTGDSFR